MQFSFEVFLCMLFGVVCVVFIAWVLRQGSDGFITTTELTSVPMDTSQPVQFAAPPVGSIEFTNMRLLVYYSRIAVQAVLETANDEPKEELHDRAVECVLTYCKVDGVEIDADVLAAIPTVIDHVFYESENRVF